MNLVDAQIERSGDGLVARFGAHALRLPAGSPAQPGRAIVGFRPEDVEDAALVPEAPEGTFLEVVPEIREDMGAEVYVHFGLGVPPVRRSEVAEAKAPEGAEPQAESVSARAASPFVARLGRGTSAKERAPLRLAVDVRRLYVFDAESGAGVYAA